MTRTLIGVFENATDDPDEVLVALSVDRVPTNIMLRDHAPLKAKLQATPRFVRDRKGESENPSRVALEAEVLAEVDASEPRDASKRATAIAQAETEERAIAEVARREAVAEAERIRLREQAKRDALKLGPRKPAPRTLLGTSTRRP
jgi:hypothetical protein